MQLTPNARQIQPVGLWLSGNLQLADVLALDNYTGYDFKGNPGGVSWTLCAYAETTDADGAVTATLQPLSSGRTELTTAVADAWGASDQVIFDHVAATLNLTLI